MFDDTLLMKELALCLKCPGSARVCSSPDVGMILEVICAVERGAHGFAGKPGGIGHPRVHLPVVWPNYA